VLSGVTPRRHRESRTNSQETVRALDPRDEGEGEDEVLDLPPLTSENEKTCSGGETRTHNLAGPRSGGVIRTMRRIRLPS
jgi:hypothetical protein